jgi:mannose-6-phosphate isomerase-like protein (cupin superfamily)
MDPNHGGARGIDLRPGARRIEKPWGYEVLFTPESAPYTGKLIHIRAGARLSLQAHERKQETWTVIAGSAAVVWEDANGALAETVLEPGLGYTCVPGQRHRLMGITDTVIVEVSTPEDGTTLRFEDDYGRGDETDTDRAEARRQAARRRHGRVKTR